ncbi:MAG: hypothetical protein GX977_10945 [Firmicutes bacterium]|nr:hypothetical protein [Bacillota bacterium]
MAVSAAGMPSNTLDNAKDLDAEKAEPEAVDQDTDPRPLPLETASTDRNRQIASSVVPRASEQAVEGSEAKGATNKAPTASPQWQANGLSEGDIWLMAQLIHAEGRGESLEGQVAIGAVLLNRMRDSRFPKSLVGVIYQPGAFCTVRDGQINLSPDGNALKAARLAAAGWDPTGGALYFYNPARSTSRWIYTRPVLARIGRHVFAA